MADKADSRKPEPLDHSRANCLSASGWWGGKRRSRRCSFKQRLICCGSARAAAPREALETLTAASRIRLEAIVARLILRRERAGAAEARAAHYIDRALVGRSPLHARHTPRPCRADTYAQVSKGGPFASLQPKDQERC